MPDQYLVEVVVLDISLLLAAADNRMHAVAEDYVEEYVEDYVEDYVEEYVEDYLEDYLEDNALVK